MLASEGPAVAERKVNDEIMPLSEIPATLFEHAIKEIANYSVGFAQVENGPHRQEVFLRGSGTLIAAGGKRAILTADHVVEKLPRDGRLGLILSPTLQQYTIDTQGLVFLRIARGTDDSEGPDLGAVVLSPSIASSIGAIKTFYNLGIRRERMLSTPPDHDLGAWAVHGFIDERTVEEPGDSGFSHVMKFYCLTGWGGPDPAVSRDGYDYHAFPVSYGGHSVAPVCFKGMSGGGLWQVPLVRDTQGTLTHHTPLLAGLVFYQVPTNETEAGVTCHGAASIYRTVYDAILTSAT